MKVGTDSVLLGSWASLPGKGRILDIGTGCGLLALMAAQRSEAEITGIDVDLNAIRSAGDNFRSSPWNQRLTAQYISLQDFLLKENFKSFEYLLSNPPYFNNSLKAPDTNRSNARHNDLLPYKLLIEAAIKLLNPSGKIGLVLPVNEGNYFSEIAILAGLNPVAEMKILPKEGKAANRLLMEFSKEYRTSKKEVLTIRSSIGGYTDEYRQLTRAFYLNF